jgi:hypothetical protein
VNPLQSVSNEALLRTFGVWKVLVLTVIAAEVTDVRFGAVKTSVCAPLPVIARVLNVAVPFAFVVAVVVPLNVPPPLAIVAVTTTPD